MQYMHVLRVCNCSEGYKLSKFLATKQFSVPPENLRKLRFATRCTPILSDDIYSNILCNAYNILRE